MPNAHNAFPMRTKPIGMNEALTQACSNAQYLAFGVVGRIAGKVSNKHLTLTSNITEIESPLPLVGVARLNARLLHQQTTAP
jgi:hypothetical protein